MKTTLLHLAVVLICRRGVLIKSSTPYGEKPKHFFFLLGDCSCVVTRAVYLGFVRCKITGNIVAFSMLRFKLAQLSPSHLNLDMMPFKCNFAEHQIRNIKNGIFCHFPETSAHPTTELLSDIKDC